MASKKPIATIAYNEKILIEVLSNKLELHEIKFFAYIIHEGEGSGESEGKKHIHVYVEPNKPIDCMEFREDFNTIEGLKTTLIWRDSKLVDWFWYVLHDEGYLKSKGLKRQYHYSFSDMYASEPEELERLLNESEVPESVRLRNALQDGLSLSEMFDNGIVRPGNALGIKAIYESILRKKISEVKKDDIKKCKD